MCSIILPPNTSDHTWTIPPTLKSIYDPCPYGYRVPPSSSFSGFPTSCPTWTNGDLTGGWLTNSTWWGAEGERVGPYGGIANIGIHILFWSASVNTATTGALFQATVAGLVMLPANYSRSSGYSTRCIPE